MAVAMVNGGRGCGEPDPGTHFEFLQILCRAVLCCAVIGRRRKPAEQAWCFPFGNGELGEVRDKDNHAVDVFCGDGTLACRA